MTRRESRMATKAASAGATPPRHVAIIMDGNGRWAKQRHLPRLEGHRRGVEAARRITRAARVLGIEALTLYAFSSENWRRPEEEVGDLMGLLRLFIRNDLDEMVRENVRLRVVAAAEHTSVTCCRLAVCHTRRILPFGIKSRHVF